MLLSVLVCIVRREALCCRKGGDTLRLLASWALRNVCLCHAGSLHLHFFLLLLDLKELTAVYESEPLGDLTKMTCYLWRCLLKVPCPLMLSSPCSQSLS